MSNYYFLAPSLPPLQLDRPPELSFQELAHRLRLNLTPSDFEKFQVLCRVIDLSNIKALYEHRPLDPNGSLNEKELEEALLVEADLPQYVFDFLRQFEGPKERARHFFGLLSRFYTEEIAKQTGFLKKLFILQREMRLILAAIRAKRLKTDLVKELQFEDFTDPLVAHILAQKEMETYEPVVEYIELKNQIEACGEDPWEIYKAVLSYEFLRIEEMSGYLPFSIDWILGYAASLLLLEKYPYALDHRKGGEIVEGFKLGR